MTVPDKTNTILWIQHIRAHSTYGALLDKTKGKDFGSSWPTKQNPIFQMMEQIKYVAGGKHLCTSNYEPVLGK